MYRSLSCILACMLAVCLLTLAGVCATENGGEAGTEGASPAEGPTASVEPVEEPVSEGPAATSEPVEEPVSEGPAATSEPVEEPVAEGPAATPEPVEEPVAEGPAVTSEPVEEPVSEGPAVTSEPVEEPAAEATAVTDEEAAPDARPEAAPDAGPEAVPDAGPEAVPDTGPEAVPDAGPKAVPDAGPEAVPAPIAAVNVSGNEHTSRDDILAVVKTEVGGTYSDTQIDRDREAVLRLGWFRRVSVEREVRDDGIHVSFQVEENPVIRDIQFEGIKVLTREELLEKMKTQPGQVYSKPLVIQDRGEIQALYESKRYDLAMVAAERMSTDGVLTLTIAEGEIQAIRIEGNTRTKEYVIRRYVRTKAGEVYNGRKLSSDVTRLMNLGYFETVRYEAAMGDDPGTVVVIITVVERRLTGNAGFGLMYGSAGGLVGFVDLVKTNVGGSGQVISLRGEFGGRTSFELGYHHPWIMSPETRLNLGLYNRFIVREAFVTPEEGGDRRTILYDERRTGGNLTLGRPISDHSTVFLRLRSDDVSISGLTAEEEPYLGGAAFAPRQVRSVTLAVSADTRDSNYNPRRGSYTQLSTEVAGILGGGANFNKYVVDTRRYFPIGGQNVLAMRLLGGVVTGEAPYLEQFLIGGHESLRGYRTDRFAGSRMAILNTEYRFPLTGNLLGVVFVDVGDAWGGAIASDPFFQGDEVFTSHVGYGVGIRVQTPIGPLRLDLGFSEEGTETHFGARHMF
jgi:outer membrane protein insertion porin family